MRAHADNHSCTFGPASSAQTFVHDLLRFHHLLFPAAVTIIGRSFANLPEMDCVIGDTMQTKALWISANAVACSIPELKPGNYSLSLSHVAVGTTLSISIVHKPRIARIFPDTIYLVDREKITVPL